MSFEINQNWQENGNPAPGDLIHLKLVDTWVYKIKVIVQQVENEEITGLVDCVFDWDTGGQIGMSAKNELIGKTLQFHSRMVFKLIKEKDAR